MAWDFHMYGIDLEQFEFACFRLLEKHGFTREQCNKYATLFYYEESVHLWDELSSAFLQKTNLFWSDQLEALGVKELFWHRSKNNCFGLNNLTQWYLTNATANPSEHLILHNHSSFFAPSPLSDELMVWVLNVIAFLERQHNPDFAIDNWDFSFNDALLSTLG